MSASFSLNNLEIRALTEIAVCDLTANKKKIDSGNQVTDFTLLQAVDIRIQQLIASPLFTGQTDTLQALKKASASFLANVKQIDKSKISSEILECLRAIRQIQMNSNKITGIKPLDCCTEILKILQVAFVTSKTEKLFYRIFKQEDFLKLCQQRRYEAMKLAIELGATVTGTPEIYTGTPLSNVFASLSVRNTEYAGTSGQAAAEEQQKVLDKGPGNNSTAAQVEVEASFLSAVQLLVRNGADPAQYYATHPKHHPTILAMDHSFLRFKEVTYYLVDNGLDVNQPIARRKFTTQQGSVTHATPLCNTVDSCHSYATRFFIYCGANIHYADTAIESPLLLSANTTWTYSFRQLDVNSRSKTITLADLASNHVKMEPLLKYARMIYELVTFRLNSIDLTPVLSTRKYGCLMPYLNRVDSIIALTKPVMHLMIDYYGFTPSEIARLCFEEEQTLDMTRAFIEPHVKDGDLPLYTAFIGPEDDKYTSMVEEGRIMIKNLVDANLVVQTNH